jgi:hypothetical protein
VVRCGRLHHAVLPQHGDRTLHPGNRRDGGGWLHPLLEALGDNLHPGAILPNLLPGWVTSSATAITFTFGFNQDLYRHIAVGLLVTIGLIVSLSPVIYQSIEKIEMVLVSVILIFLVFAIFIATEGSVWAGVITKSPQGIAEFPRP